MKTISINGKFLGQELNGVHRTAALFSEALRKAAPPEIAMRLAIPPRSSGAFTPTIPTWPAAGQYERGQLWEQLTLPVVTRDDLLLNFCNLGPLNHPCSVVMIHDMQTSLVPKDYSIKQKLGYKLLLPQIGRHSARILTVSEFSRQSLIDYGIADADKIVTVLNGGDHILSTPAEGGVIDAFGLADRPFALTIGSSKSYKNISMLLKVFSDPAMADMTLVVAGGPPARRYLGHAGRKPDNVIFTGFVSDGDLRGMFEQATVFLFPSLTEGFGLPPVEAMHCGCPVITTRCGAIPEVCGTAVDFADPNDPDDWVAAIARMREADYRAGRIAAGHEQARQYTWQRSGAALWNAIRDLA